MSITRQTNLNRSHNRMFYKKKIMKKIIYLLLALLSIIYVSSCSKSDDIENNADIPNTNNFKVVDLGLPSGLKWASCNLGASKPEELGSLYAWGELSEKEEYTSTNAKWYGRSTSALKSDKIIDYNGNLTPENDVVTVKLGEKWRMPTNGEKLELAEYCIWSTSKLNGVSGLLITGPNGNSIFSLLQAITEEHITDGPQQRVKMVLPLKPIKNILIHIT